MKKCLAILLAVCLCFSVLMTTGCSFVVKSLLSSYTNDSVSSVDPWGEEITFSSMPESSKPYGPAESGQEESRVESVPEEQSSSQEESTSSQQESSSQDNPGTVVTEENMKYVFYSDEGGYSKFYRSSGFSGPSGDVLLDRNGDTAYSFIGTTEELLVYANGFFLSKDGDMYYLKTATGYTVASTETLGATGFGMVEDTTSHREFLADGYVLVYKTVESYNGVTYEVGILGTNGQWIVPLSAEHPFVTGGVECSEEDLQEDLQYLQQGCILAPTDDVPGYDYDDVVYSISANELLLYSTNERVGNMDYMLTQIEFDENGISRGLYGDRMYEYHTDGSFNTYIVKPDVITGSWGDYGFYVDDSGETYTLGGDGWGAVLYTPDEIICDYQDDLNVDVVCGAYCGQGQWLISIQNTEGTLYYAMIDYTGDFVFEPIKTDAQFVMLEDNIGVSTDSDYASQDNGKKIIIDRDGNVLYENEYHNADIEVRNGIVREEEFSAFGSGDEHFYALYK